MSEICAECGQVVRPVLVVPPPPEIWAVQWYEDEYWFSSTRASIVGRDAFVANSENHKQPYRVCRVPAGEQEGSDDATVL